MGEGRQSAQGPLAEAADWHVRLQSDAATEADWLAFENWLGADPAHGAAYDQIALLDADLADAASDLGRALAKSPPTNNVTPLPVRPTARRPRLLEWAWIPAAAAAVAVVWLVMPWGGRDPPAVDYATAVGQTRVITLADGSIVHMGGGSRLSVRVGKGERRVVLDEAEAAFDVARDPARPFVIVAGDRRVTVLGTEFNVLRHDGQLTVTVRRGVVKVASETGDDTARLTVGQQLTHPQGAPNSIVRSVAPDDAFAWIDGRLVYHDAPLSAVAADLGRHFATPIRVEGVGALRFSGVLALDSEDKVVARLEAYLPVRAERTSGAIVLRARR